MLGWKLGAAGSCATMSEMRSLLKEVFGGTVGRVGVGDAKAWSGTAEVAIGVAEFLCEHN